VISLAIAKKIITIVNIPKTCSYVEKTFETPWGRAEPKNENISEGKT
jgi:hypothetical protein